MTGTVTTLPTPSKKHATCAWCRKDFDAIVDLLDHVDNGHLDHVEDGRDERSAA